MDKPPIFGDCSNVDCSSNALIKYIYKNLNYPRAARAKKIQGLVYTQFVVEQNGKVSDIKIVRDIGYGCGEEVLAVIIKMNEMEQPWVPGILDGKYVKVLYTIPVMFKLSR